MKKSYWTRMGGISSVVLLAAAFLCQTSSAATWGTTNWTQVLSNNVFSTPAISPDGATLYVVDNSSRAYAINAASGTMLKQWKVNSGAWGSPVVSRDGSTLYVVADTNLFSLNTAAGTTNSVNTLPGSSDTAPALFERPLTSTDTNAGYVFVGDYANNFSCFAINNLTTPLWTRKTLGAIESQASIGPDGLVYVGNTSNQLVVFDMQGNTNCVLNMPQSPTFATYGGLYASPAFGEVNGAAVVYMVNHDYQMYSFSLSTKALNWVSGQVGNTTGSGGCYEGPVIGPDGYVYMGHEAPGGILRFNPITGAYTVLHAGQVWSTPAIGLNGTLFFGDQGGAGTCYALNPTNGVTNTFWSLPGTTYCSPTIGTNGTVYIGTYGSPMIYAYNNAEPLASENSFWPKKHQNTRNTGLSKPSVPASVAVAIEVSDTLVSWSSSPVAMAYLVYKNTTTNFSTASLIATVAWTNTAYTDAGEGALNYYWVRAWNDSGLSTVGAWASATPLPVPMGVSASDGTYTDKVRVMWDAVSGPVSYEVWRNTSSNFSSASKISSPALSELGLEDASATADATYYLVYDDASATAGINYYYWVKAVNDMGDKSLSTSDSGYLGVVGPVITANGLLGNVYLNAGDPVTLAIQMMNVDPYVGLQVDWWVIAFAHTGQWYYMNNLFQWTYFNGNLHACHPVYQGPLANLGPAPVLSGGILGAGTYTFWFAVDYPRNGILNGDAMLFDSVNVIVQ